MMQQRVWSWTGAVLAVATLSLPSSAVDAEPVKELEVVARAIEHHGGEKFQGTETELDICSKSGCFHVLARVNGSEFLYEVEGRTPQGERRVRMTNDTTEVWLDGAEVRPKETEIQAFRDWSMARVYFCFLPYRLNDDSVWKEDRGTELWGDKSLRRVRVTFEAGSSTDASDVYNYWFNEETGRLEQFAYSYQGNPGGARFRRLENFRRVGGLLFFDQINLGAEGDQWAPDRLGPESVEGLPEISRVTLRNIIVRPLYP